MGCAHRRLCAGRHRFAQQEGLREDLTTTSINQTLHGPAMTLQPKSVSQEFERGHANQSRPYGVGQRNGGSDSHPQTREETRAPVNHDAVELGHGQPLFAQQRFDTGR
ncbi:unannotated protein [freshwater metagenome]|uniref:Unannotated protein n=1 Tax=freshwater metagenome TaxID=449393 RepID=A0A6J6WU52_9ZZZZ